MDIFCEYMVVRKKNAKDYLIIAGIVVLALIFTVLFTFTPLMAYLYGMWIVLDAGIWWGAIYLIKRRSLEFEYILTNHELDIDRIVARQLRRRITTIDFKNIECCARVGDPEYSTQYASTQGRDIFDATADPKDAAVVFVDFFIGDKKKRILFQPGKNMCEELKKINPRAVHL